MTQEQEAQLKTFKYLVTRLIDDYQAERARCASLKAQVEELKQRLAVAESETAGARHDYEVLKMARMLEVSGDDVQASRQRLARLIREVDKCIALLSV